MKLFVRQIAFIIFCILHFGVNAIEVERFEKLTTADGLSQNSVHSSFCDSRGFLWFGTMNGLNRYDGYNFHIYRKKTNDAFSLSSNRIVRIWEDSNGFIWAESHDGHYQYLDITTDKFYTFPRSSEISNNQNVRITSFLETNENEIWLGTDNSGIYYLKLNENGIYNSQHFSSRDVNPITNDKVRFIISDSDSNIWIGTANGVNRVTKPTQTSEEFIFQHYLIDHSFTSGLSLKDKNWFGTDNKGLVSYNLQTSQFEKDTLIADSIKISVLKKNKSDNLIIGTLNSGLKIANPLTNQSFSFFQKQSILKIYMDTQEVLWLVSNKPGISRLNLNSSVEQHFELVPKEISHLVVEERAVFFEDAEGNVWIGTHGGGLGLYNSDKSEVEFFRNKPQDEFSVSSDVIHSITQDKSGLIWVGTGQSNGALNKVIAANPLFKHVQLEENVVNQTDNIVRCIFQDDKDNIWLATKSGQIFIYDQEFNFLAKLEHKQNSTSSIPKSSIYTVMQDNEGYLWIGTKGGGVAVSQFPLKSYKNYKKIKFNTYKNITGDSSSLSNNYVYSIIQDNNGGIWIGTYGGGINRVQNRTASKLSCIRFTTENSDLSSDEIRYIYQDKKHRIWYATTYGLNLLEPDSELFLAFTHDQQNEKSLSYNDVVHIFEDDEERLWFGTFGGGVNYLMNDENPHLGFKPLTVDDGLINNAVFGIEQDNFGKIWFSTQNGISCYNPEDNSFDNFDTNNGLLSSDFSENTSATLRNGKVLFGNTAGLQIVTPDVVTSKPFSPPICFTGFLLFNKEVNINEEDSPLQKSINYTDKIILKHNQSSFSFEYAALSYFDPEKNQYSYMLENFDDTWYNVKNERKATYTNVSPGEYIFKVKASNWDGTWTETPREIKIIIRRPWWGTPLAYLAYFILLSISFEFWRRIYINNQRLKTDLKVEKRVNEIKLQFFTNISHEIRTPLTLILGPLEDLKKNANLPATINAPLNIMNRNGKRILRLVNQLLDFRKIQNQKMNLKVKEVEIYAFTQEICSNFEQLAHQKNIHFTFPESHEEKCVWIDKEKIDSVLFNILSNAFKFTKNGKSIDLNIRENPSNISIVVKDEGKGISKNKLPEIFKRFNTLSTDEIDFTGTGIGLAYSYELMKLHYGDIHVESKLGEGSTFTILIPKGKEHLINEKTTFIEKETVQKYSHADEYNLEAITEIIPENGEEIRKQHKVVIVEDNLEVINYIESILNKYFKTFHAFNGKEGLKKILEVHPDLIITDLMMPEMDGMTMTKTIKEDFSVSHIPVVMLTAKSTIDDQIEGIETGAEAYVLKPFNSDYLISVVSNLLKQRQIVIKKYSELSFSGELKITNRDEEFIKNTINIIEENCQNADFNVNDLIKKSFLGRTVFFNKIKGLTGLSPVEFVRKTKLQIAGRQLKENNCGVAEAAYFCGFNNVKYFTKCFKKEFGINPSEYKKHPEIC